MHRRNEIDWALPNITPKAVPDAPLGLLARQCQADADVEAAAAITAPTITAIRKRPMIALPDVYARRRNYTKILVVLTVFLAFAKLTTVQLARRHPSIDGNRQCQCPAAEYPQPGKLLACQLVVVAAVVITAPVGSARGAARNTRIRHRRQRAADTSLRRADTEYHSILSSTEQHH
jgi:hypothetical protein